MEQDPTAARPIRIPGPDHPITIDPNPNRVTVSVAGKVVAHTTNALTLREAGYAPVQYIPRENVDMSLLERTDHVTYCPYKGECSYFGILIDGEKLANAVWTYEAPFPAVSPIKEYVAFYENRVDMLEDSLGD